MTGLLVLQPPLDHPPWPSHKPFQLGHRQQPQSSQVLSIVGVPVGIGGCRTYVREPLIACSVIKNTISVAKPATIRYLIDNTLTDRGCRGLLKPLS